MMADGRWLMAATASKSMCRLRIARQSPHSNPSFQMPPAVLHYGTRPSHQRIPSVPDPVVSSSDAELRAHVERALSANYELDKEIGRGGMGIVYKARDRRLKRPVGPAVPGARASWRSGAGRGSNESQGELPPGR